MPRGPSQQIRSESLKRRLALMYCLFRHRRCSLRSGPQLAAVNPGEDGVLRHAVATHDVLHGEHFQASPKRLKTFDCGVSFASFRGGKTFPAKFSGWKTKNPGFHRGSRGEEFLPRNFAEKFGPNPSRIFDGQFARPRRTDRHSRHHQQRDHPDSFGAFSSLARLYSNPYR